MRPIELDKSLLGPMLHRVRPMEPVEEKEPFDREGWIFEIKFDGYRATAEVNGDEVNLYSSEIRPFNREFPPLVSALGHLNHGVVFDGEVVILDKDGKSDFRALEHYTPRHRNANLVYCVFDLMWIDGYDIRKLPLLERKKILQNIVPENPPIPNVHLVEYHENEGISVFEAIKTQKFEGMVAKDGNSPYIYGGPRPRYGMRRKYWIKVKDPNYKREAESKSSDGPRL